MSPRTLDSLMHNEAEANPGHLGERLAPKAATFFHSGRFNRCLRPTDSLTLEMDVASPMWRGRMERDLMGPSLAPVYSETVLRDRETDGLSLLLIVNVNGSYCWSALAPTFFHKWTFMRPRLSKNVMFLKLFLPLYFSWKWYWFLFWEYNSNCCISYTIWPCFDRFLSVLVLFQRVISDFLPNVIEPTFHTPLT